MHPADGDPCPAREPAQSKVAPGASTPGTDAPQMTASDGATHSDAEVEKRATVRADAGLAAERRNERQFVRAQLPMEVEHRGTTYHGFDVSLSGFSCVGTLAIDDDDVDDFAIRLLFHGYALTVEVKALRVRQIEAQDLNAFQIVEIEDAQVEVLRKVLRAHLSGQLVTVDGVLTSADSQTARQAASAASNDANALSGRALWRRRAWYCGIAIGAAALVLVLAASLFERFAVVDAAFAAVTAPKLDIGAPADGEVGTHLVRPGDRLARDQFLAQIVDRHLDADLDLARARLAMARLLLESTHQRLDASPPPAPFALPAPAPERQPALQATIGLEQARVTALEHRIEANRLYAPCPCSVYWAVPAGEWVRKGDLLFTLIRTGASDLLVEALVPLRSIDRIHQHQVAFIDLPNSDQLVEARVARITLDSLRQPRAGFPRWMQQDESLASVLLRPSRPLASDGIGRPVRVVFSDLPAVTIGAAHLRSQLAQLGRVAMRALGEIRPAVLAATEFIGHALAGEEP